jgi:hypothetical protein
MARRKRKRPLKSVKIDELAHERLAELQIALEGQALPSYVEDMEILSALILYTTPQQLAGMLRGYWQATERLASPTERDPSEPGS